MSTEVTTRGDEDQVPSLKEIVQRMRHRLEEVFDTFSEGGVLLTPDKAMEELDLALSHLSETWGPARFSVLTSRFDKVAFRCSIHHHAVDLYYRQRQQGAKRRRGAPPLTDEYAIHVLQLMDEGKSVNEIAKELGLKGRGAKDRMRHQIRIAVARAKASVGRLRKLAAEQTVKNEAAEVSAAQSKAAADSQPHLKNRERKIIRESRRKK